MYILVKAKALTHEGASTLVSMLPLPCQLLLLWYVGDRQEAYRLVKHDKHLDTSNMSVAADGLYTQCSQCYSNTNAALTTAGLRIMPENLYNCYSVLGQLYNRFRYYCR